MNANLALIATAIPLAAGVVVLLFGLSAVLVQISHHRDISTERHTFDLSATGLKMLTGSPGIVLVIVGALLIALGTYAGALRT